MFEEPAFEVHCLKICTIDCIIPYYNCLVITNERVLRESFHFMVDVLCYSLVTSTTLVMSLMSHDKCYILKKVDVMVDHLMTML